MPSLLLGEQLEILVLTTTAGHRVGVPMGHQTLANLHIIVMQGLALLKAGDGDAVQ